nr:hypothetical protein [Tanacetum cinerariifolium]
MIKTSFSWQVQTTKVMGNGEVKISTKKARKALNGRIIQMHAKQVRVKELKTKASSGVMNVTSQDAAFVITGENIGPKPIPEIPKTDRPSAPIIEEWESDSDNDSTISPISDQPKHTPIKINFVKRVEYVECGENEKQSEKPMSFTQNPKGAGQWETRPVWDTTTRVNHQNKLTHPYPKRNFVPAAILTKSGQVLVNAAKQSSHKAATSVSAARRVNTAAPRPNVNSARSTTTQDLVIIKLIQRVKRLEKELKARTPPIKIQKGRKNDTNEEFNAADEEQKQ